MLEFSDWPSNRIQTRSQALPLFGWPESLIANGAQVRAYDPVAIPDARTELNGTVHYCDSPYAAAEGVDALVVGTGWPEFRALDFDRIKQLLRRPLYRGHQEPAGFDTAAGYGI